LTTTVACAHDGHGAEQLHVHAGDVVGLLLALAGIGVVLWLRRK
jgi:hypothetical protein